MLLGFAARNADIMSTRVTLGIADNAQNFPARVTLGIAAKEVKYLYNNYILLTK